MAVNLGLHEDFMVDQVAGAIAQLLPAAKTRAKMSQLGRELVDGFGCERILQELER